MNLFDFIDKHPYMTIFIVIMINITLIDSIKIFKRKGE